MGHMQRMPLMNEGLQCRDMPVSHSGSGLPMTSSSAALSSADDYSSLYPSQSFQQPSSGDAYQYAMYPPVPPSGSEHLQTGRFYEIRNTSPDLEAASYIELGILRVISVYVALINPL